MVRTDDISTVFLVLRRLRGMLISLILIYAVSVLGMVLVPGPPDYEGQTTHMSFFHAFYFVSYTATTIGFGEIPAAFSEQQRLWAIFIIYLSVIGWTMFIGSLLSLSQDANLRRAVRARHFGIQVRRLREPFFIVCGYGETGRLILRVLDRMRMRAVVLEVNPERLAEIDLHTYVADMPALAADAANPETLKLAGLGHPYCRGIMALTNDDATNLAVAISVKLLAPGLPALCRAANPATATSMAAFGTRHIINPYERFGDYLALALKAPAAYFLLGWLTGEPGQTRARHRAPPHGEWIVCGYGDFGQALAHSMGRLGVPITVIDQHPPLPSGPRWVQGDGTGEAVLRDAGIARASAIVAATSNDISNLSIAVTARQLNPHAFIVLRQNNHANQALFDTFAADVTVVPSEIVAQVCLAILTTPLLSPFLNAMREAGNDWCESLLERLQSRLGETVPEVWSVRLNISDAPAVHRALMYSGKKPLLSDLLRDPSDRSQVLKAEVLCLQRGGEAPVLLPGADTLLAPGDELLIASRPRVRASLLMTLCNAHTLTYVLTGRNVAGGWIWRKLESRLSSY